MYSTDEGLPSDIDVSLEFRTHKTDGLLMMFDGTDGSQTMVLELHQGQVGASCFANFYIMVDVKKIQTLVACQKGLDKQGRPKSDCF